MVFEDKRKDRNLKENEGEYLCAASASHRLLRAIHRHALSHDEIFELYVDEVIRGQY